MASTLLKYPPSRHFGKHRILVPLSTPPPQPVDTGLTPTPNANNAPDGDNANAPDGIRAAPLPRAAPEACL